MGQNLSLSGMDKEMKIIAREEEEEIEMNLFKTSIQERVMAE